MKELDKVLVGISVCLDCLIKSIQVQSNGTQAAQERCQFQEKEAQTFTDIKKNSQFPVCLY